MRNFTHISFQTYFVINIIVSMINVVNFAMVLTHEFDTEPGPDGMQIFFTIMIPNWRKLIYKCIVKWCNTFNYIHTH